MLLTSSARGRSTVLALAVLAAATAAVSASPFGHAFGRVPFVISGDKTTSTNFEDLSGNLPAHDPITTINGSRPPAALQPNNDDDPPVVVGGLAAAAAAAAAPPPHDANFVDFLEQNKKTKTPEDVVANEEFLRAMGGGGIDDGTASSRGNYHQLGAPATRPPTSSRGATVEADPLRGGEDDDLRRDEVDAVLHRRLAEPPNAAPPGYEYFGQPGHCQDASGEYYDWGLIPYGGTYESATFAEAAAACPIPNTNDPLDLVGISDHPLTNECRCWYNNHAVPTDDPAFDSTWTASAVTGPCYAGTGPVKKTSGDPNWFCYPATTATETTTEAPTTTTDSPTNDPPSAMDGFGSVGFGQCRDKSNNWYDSRSETGSSAAECASQCSTPYLVGVELVGGSSSSCRCLYENGKNPEAVDTSGTGTGRVSSSTEEEGDVCYKMLGNQDTYLELTSGGIQLDVTESQDTVSIPYESAAGYDKDVLFYEVNQEATGCDYDSPITGLAFSTAEVPASPANGHPREALTVSINVTKAFWSNRIKEDELKASFCASTELVDQLSNRTVKSDDQIVTLKLKDEANTFSHDGVSVAKADANVTVKAYDSNFTIETYECPGLQNYEAGVAQSDDNMIDICLKPSSGKVKILQDTLNVIVKQNNEVSVDLSIVNGAGTSFAAIVDEREVGGVWTLKIQGIILPTMFRNIDNSTGTPYPLDVAGSSILGFSPNGRRLGALLRQHLTVIQEEHIAAKDTRDLQVQGESAGEAGLEIVIPLDGARMDWYDHNNIVEHEKMRGEDHLDPSLVETYSATTSSANTGFGRAATAAVQVAALLGAAITFVLAIY